MPSAASFAPVFAALGDETRLRLIVKLCGDGPMSITKLTAGSDVTRQAITKHLLFMQEAGLVHHSRQGRESVWELDPQRLDEAGRQLDAISQQWDAALNRLKNFVES